MNREQINQKVRLSMDKQVETNGYATVVQTLMDLNVLSQKDYEDWRRGRVPYLEKICHANLSKLSYMLRQISQYGKERDLNPSWTDYRQWGKKGKKVKLRFTKFHDENMEKAYATHYVKKK